MMYLLQRAVDASLPFLVIGPTGTGKSTYIARFLKEKLPIE